MEEGDNQINQSKRRGEEHVVRAWTLHLEFKQENGSFDYRVARKGMGLYLASLRAGDSQPGVSGVPQRTLANGDLFWLSQLERRHRHPVGRS